MSFQTNFLRNIIEFLAADVFELLAAGLQFLIDFDGLLSHPLVGLFRAADERKVVSGRNAFMTVGIQSEAEDYGFAFLLLRLVRHQLKVRSEAGGVKRFKPDVLC